MLVGWLGLCSTFSSLRTQATTVLLLLIAVTFHWPKPVTWPPLISREWAVRSYHGSGMRRTCVFVNSPNADTQVVPWGHCPQNQWDGDWVGGKQNKGPGPASSIQGSRRSKGTCSLLRSPAPCAMGGGLRISLSGGWIINSVLVLSQMDLAPNCALLSPRTGHEVPWKRNMGHPS